MQIKIINSSIKTLREAVELRKRSRLPNVTPILLLVTLFTLALIATALLAAPAGSSPDYQFSGDHRIITIFSEFFLVTASTFSLGILIVQIRDRNSFHLLWGLLALGFLILYFDELIHLNSIAGRILQNKFGLQNFYQWKDYIVILYGLVALAVLLVFLPELFHYPLVFELFSVGFVFYILHTFMDATQDNSSLAVIIEESAKVISSSCLAQGALVGFLGALWNLGGTESTKV